MSQQSWFGNGARCEDESFNELVRFEELWAAHGLPGEREVLEGQVADAGAGLAPEELRLIEDARRGDGDVLEK